MFRKILISAAVSVALLAGVSAQAADQPPLKVGAIMAMTGALQAYGETSLNGVKLAVDEINEAGGVLGKPLKLTVGDAQTKPQAGVVAANKLVNIDGAEVFVGALSSGVTIPIATSVAKPNKIPMVSPASTSPVITTLNDDGYLFRTVSSDAYQGVALAEMVDDHDIEKVAIIYVNNDYGKGMAEAFRKAFEKRGGTVTQSVAYEAKQPSYTALIQKAWGDGSTPHLVLVAYVGDGETILRQSLEGAMFTKFIFTDGMKTEQLVENIGAQYLNGSFGSIARTPQGEAAKRFNQAYESKYGKRPPQPYIDTAYDAVYLLALAAQKAGTTTDGEAIKKALHAVSTPPGEEILPGEWDKAVKLLEQGKEINWTGAAGGEDFDKNGDISTAFAEWAFEDGQIVIRRIINPSASDEGSSASDGSSSAEEK